MFSFNSQLVTNNDPLFNTPLTFIAVEPSSSIQLYKAAGSPAASEYIKVGFSDPQNQIEWSDYEVGTTITLQDIGDKVYFKGLLSSFSESPQNYFRFATSGLFDCDGNIQSLLNFSDTVTDYGFVLLFRACNLRKPPKFLAHNVNYWGCSNTFKGCSSLIEPPIINATKVGDSGYMRTFYECTSMKDSPKLLPFRYVGESGTDLMFYKCTDIENASKINVKKAGDKACFEMYWRCFNLKDASNFTISVSAPSAFYGLFQQCSSLIIPCNITSNAADEYCYTYMFAQCSGLLEPPELPATIISPHCYQHMFDSCHNLQYCPELPALEVPQEGYTAMFKYCYSLKDMPNLPATKIGNDAYYSMFAWDENITGYVAELPATSATPYCYGQMFFQNYGMKKAPKINLQNVDVGCCEKMFYNCSGLIEAPELLMNSLTPTTPYASGYAPNVGDKIWGALEWMFNGCTSLSSITVNFTEWEPSGTLNWVSNVYSDGNFYCPSSLSAEYGTNRIPTNWNKIDK